jgi:hypothetical protein
MAQLPAYDRKGQPMAPGGQFMAENDKSCGKGKGPDLFFCSVLSPQHSVLIELA